MKTKKTMLPSFLIMALLAFTLAAPTLAQAGRGHHGHGHHRHDHQRHKPVLDSNSYTVVVGSMAGYSHGVDYKYNCIH